jgi:hypothetical protein
MSGIVYMVQPAELVGSNKFKIGCSSKNDLSRCKAYKVGTRYIHIMECTDPLTVEKEIIRVFKLKYKLTCGREFFEGKETDMEAEFYKIVKNRNKLARKADNQPNTIPKSNAVIQPITDTKSILTSENEGKPEIKTQTNNPLQCPYCNYVFTEINKCTKHMIKCRTKPVDTNAFKCECAKTYKYKQGLDKHQAKCATYQATQHK